MFLLDMTDAGPGRLLFEEIYERYRGLMLHVALGILKQPEDAEDAVQNAFLSLLKISGRIRSACSPETQALCVITVRHKAIDILRRRRDYPEEDMTLFTPPVPGIPEEHGLAAALARLPDRYRDLILLRYDLGYSTKEIAELTDTTRAAVQKTLFRARKALEKEMEAL